MAGGPGLMNEGIVGAPSSGMYNLIFGEWEIENIRVAPEVVVEQDPGSSEGDAIRSWRRP
jgi:hypothetical protein